MLYMTLRGLVVPGSEAIPFLLMGRSQAHRHFPGCIVISEMSQCCNRLLLAQCLAVMLYITEG